MQKIYERPEARKNLQKAMKKVMNTDSVRKII